jgi:transcriptional regulator with XRE-family HTH domain
VDPLVKAIGRALREAREELGLTLRQAAERSDGRFKPSVVGGYERAERSISLARFCELADFYGVPPERLLTRALELLGPEARPQRVLDLTRLERQRAEDASGVPETGRDLSP